jgi:Domain of unknown function (DUF892)
MAKAAPDEKLRAAFKTEGPIERLEQVLELLGKPARGKRCDAIGIVSDTPSDARAVARIAIPCIGLLRGGVLGRNAPIAGCVAAAAEISALPRVLDFVRAAPRRREKHSRAATPQGQPKPCLS